MKEENIIYNQISDYWKLMNIPCKKLLGSATVMTIRKHLLKHKFNVSQKDVFIKGIPTEIDLLLLKNGVAPNLLLYNPNEVLAVFEIKFRGSFGLSTINAVQKLYDRVKSTHKEISCFYVALLEGEDYKHRVTKQNTKFNVFEVFYYKGDLKRNNITLKNTDDWSRLLKYIEKIYNSHPH